MKEDFMKRFRILLSLGVLATCFMGNLRPAAPVKAADSASTYNVVGVTYDDKIYSGKVDVKALTDTLYSLNWTLDSGNTYSGIGLVDNKNLSVGLGDKCTIVSYMISQDGLGGIWAQIGSNKMGTETATLTGTATDGKIGGDYTVTGTNPDKSQYKGNLTVTPHGDVYQFSWKFDSSTDEGIGILQNGVVSVAFGDTNCSVATFQESSDGSLSGVWGTYGQNSIGLEEISVSLAGKYTVTGTNPDNSGYKGGLELTEHGPVYQFSWTVGSNSYDGIGVRQAGTISVGWGDTTCGVVAYRILDSGALYGLWGQYGQNNVGAEFAASQKPGADISGNYAVEGIDFNNKSYKDSLTVKTLDAKNGFYNFTWTTADNQTEQGFGIQFDDVVSVSLGGAKCAVASYKVDGNRNLTGLWGGLGSSATGTENAAPAN
jgi:hypothetical protein